MPRGCPGKLDRLETADDQGSVAGNPEAQDTRLGRRAEKKVVEVGKPHREEDRLAMDATHSAFQANWHS